MLQYLGRIISLVLGFAGIFPTIAQDSTQTKFDTKSFLLFSTTNQIDFYTKHPSLLYQSTVRNFGVAQLSYNQVDGYFKRVQEPQGLTKMSFSSYGIRDIKNIRVSGSFIYEREWQREAGLAHRYDIYDPSPYYLFAQKPGNWNKISYVLSGDMTTNLLSKRLRVGVGTDYIARQNYRTIDPRPNINVFGFKPRFSVGYELSKHFYTGITYRFGYGKNDVSVGYKNDLYGSSLIYPEYINYLNAGFGYVLQQQTVTNGKSLRERIQENDLELAIAISKEFYKINLLTGLKSKKQSYYRNASTSNFEFDLSTFQLNSPYLSVRYNYKTPSKYWLSEVTLEQQQGKDYNAQLNGNNFVYNTNRIGILTGYTSIQFWEFYLNGILESMDKADGVSNNRMKLSSTTVSLRIAKAWHWRQKQTIKIGLRTQLKQNLSAKLVISPIFESEAVQQIIRPDYDYLRSNSMDSGLELNYLYQKSKFSNMFIKGSFSFQQNLSNNALALGKSRSMIEISTGIIF